MKKIQPKMLAKRFRPSAVMFGASIVIAGSSIFIFPGSDVVKEMRLNHTAVEMDDFRLNMSLTVLIISALLVIIGLVGMLIGLTSSLIMRERIGSRYLAAAIFLGLATMLLHYTIQQLYWKHG